ncbi:hypothetical protein L593_12260 [Salinarchaeum sp. Harcht-Bsk1]|uniref:ATP-binding protein n=1 Tax=Salinarchaeum sp. Harcht-Bsk1 TaxID=1333523 RepID=UPI0003423AD8|nr:AAA family ATPase [Salinarchaeum sp. Harcht-Bsk1]AGN02393.1 hypothetical protein L593_12260 [Salinarchaeum sp. Harcht-Bsk1]
MAVDPADSLVRALDEHNPWWERGADAFSLPARQRSDFYHLARPDDEGSQFEDQPILGLTGRRGAGKTTLLKQFVQHRIQQGDAPEQFCYLPFDADPLFQLQSDEQLRRAVRYYENRVLSAVDEERPHFLLLDDVHLIEHPNKTTIEGWGTPVAKLIEDAPRRHVAVTASAGVQVDRELDRVGIDESEYGVQPILPEKFRDYVFSLYPDLEEGDTRVSPTSLREGEHSLPEVLRTGDVEPFVAELRRKYEQVEGEERRIQSQLVDYLAMGGIVSYAQDGVVESASDLESADYAMLRENVRDALYQEVPGFESIQTIGDLERLCALAARNRGGESLKYQDLVDLFDVDRRTIVDSYLPALETLYLLTGVNEYDNARPRSVRLFLRDPGLVVALTGGSAGSVLADFDLETDLARVTAFDHTMRFAYGIEAIQGRDEAPSVQYWEGREGEVDFVFEVDGTPVPVGLAYRSGDREVTRSAIGEFRSEYEAPIGILLTGDTAGRASIEDVQQGIVTLPYWFYLLLC